jgi:hypothetical protein
MNRLASISSVWEYRRNLIFFHVLVSSGVAILGVNIKNGFELILMVTRVSGKMRSDNLSCDDCAYYAAALP